MAVSSAIDAAIQSFSSLPAAIAAIYSAVGDRKIARSDFGFAIVDWASYMVSIEPYVRRALEFPDIGLQAQRVLDLCVWLGHWLYSIGFRQSRATAKLPTLQGLRFPYFWLDKKYQRFEAKLQLIKVEGEQLKQSVSSLMESPLRLSLHQKLDQDTPLLPEEPSPVPNLQTIHETANKLDSVSTRLLTK
ncbi:hypothetical protein LOZ58_004632 [Ophidiomyces ophidiicola]|nr:hypothetical protein LOZ66_005758 [Ophidiomyces ophidiicola]KAI1959361.1 hypothetical protein LOZ58_004632 [Ophidiomyces ophidiicola]